MITASDFLKWLNIFNVPSGNAPTGPVTKQEVQQSAFNYSVATGADDAFVVILDPAVVNLTDGLLISLSSAYTNLTTTPTIQVNSLSPVPIILADNADLAPGDIQPDNSYLLEYNFANSAFQLLNPTYSTANTFSTQENAYNFAIDSGSVNALAVELLPAPQNITAGAFPVFIQLLNTNTGAVTISINSSSTIPVLSMQGNPLIGGEMVLNYISYLLYNPEQSAFILQNSALPSGATAQQVQQSAFNVGIDSGVADAYVVTLSPAISALTNGLIVEFTPNFQNATTSPTIDVGTGANAIQLANGSSVLPGDLQFGFTYVLQFNNVAGNVWYLLNPTLSYVTALNLFYLNQGGDSGSVNAYSSIIGADLAFNAGTIFVLYGIQHTNTGASTVTINGSSAIPITTLNGEALVGGELIAFETYFFFYNGTNVLLINPSVSSSVTPLQVQQSAFNVGTDTGVADAYVVVLNPPVTLLTNGFQVTFAAAHANATASPTLQINALTPVPILTWNGGSLQIADIADAESLTQTYIYNQPNNYFELMNPQLSIIYPFNLTANTWIKSNDSGIANAYVATPQYVPSFVGAGFIQILYSIAHSNTGASTFTLGANTSAIVLPNGSALIGGEILLGLSYEFMFNGTNWILMNSSLSTGGGDAYAQSVALLTSAFQTTNYILSQGPETTLDFSMLLVGLSPMGGSFYNATSVNLDNVSSLDSMTTNFHSVLSFSMPSLTTIVSGNFVPHCESALTVSLPSLATVAGDYAPIFTSATSVSLPSLTTVGGQFESKTDSATTLSYPALSSILGFDTTSMGSLTSIDLSSLATVGTTQFQLEATILTTLSLPALSTIDSGVNLTTPALTTFSMNAGLLEINGNFSITGASLDLASVDGILASLAALDGTGGTTAYSSLTIDLSGGTSAAPDAAGLASIAILTGRGNTVNHN